MNAPISPISAQALNLVPVASLPVPSSKNDGWILRLRADRRLYESDGTQWNDFLSGGAPPVGSIDANSPINGNPAALDTPAELAAEIQALQVAMGTKLGASVFDKDGDNRLDVDALDDLEIPFTTPSTTWNYTHNLGRIPQVTVLDDTGNEFDADPQFPDLNNITIEFITPKTGKLILH